MNLVRPFLPVLGFGLVACTFPPPETTQTGGPTPREGGAQCAEDGEVDDVVAIDAPGPADSMPILRAVTDADGAAAVWYDEAGGLSFRRWDARGTPLTPATSIASAVQLPGGADAISGVSIGFGAGTYLVGHEGPSVGQISAVMVTPAGVARQAVPPRAAAANDQQRSPIVSGRDDALFLQWTEVEAQTNARKLAVQAYDANGKHPLGLGAPPNAEGGQTDALVANGRLSVVHYQSQAGVGGEADVMFRQAEVGSLDRWTSSRLELRRPVDPTKHRADAALLAVDDHTFFADRVRWGENNTVKHWLEIAEIDASGVLVADHSFELPDDRIEIGNPAIAREDKRVYVAWIDTDVTGNATLRVWMLDRDTGKTNTGSAPLSLAKGRGFINNERAMGGIRVSGGRVRASYVWFSMEGNRKTRHLGLRSICFAKP